MVAEFITFKYLQKRYAGLYLYSYLSPENIRSGPAFANIFTISISSAISKFNYLLCGFIVLCVFFHYHNIMLCISYSHSLVFFPHGITWEQVSFLLLLPPLPTLIVPHKNMTNTEIWTKRISSVFSFLNLFIHKVTHFIIPYFSYFTLFRVCKLIPECPLYYGSKQIILCFSSGSSCQALHSTTGTNPCQSKAFKTCHA